MRQESKELARRFGMLWLGMALAMAVAVVEALIRGHVEWVHVAGSSVGMATAVALASGLGAAEVAT